MNEGFLTYDHFYFIIKTSMKLVGFFYHFFNDTFMKSFLPFFFFRKSLCIISTNFSRYCGWLRFAAQPKLLFFYSGHLDVCTA